MPSFHIEKDIQGNYNNGWTASSNNEKGKVKLRFATVEEINMYNVENKPVKVIKNDYFICLNLI